MTNKSHSRLSHATSGRIDLSGLSAGQQDRLTTILDDYLVMLEKGTPPNRDEIISANGDIGPQIERYLASLEFLQDAAGGFAESSFDVEHDSPEELGEFRLVKQIGRGGMGVVYEAWQESLGRRVALKVLPFASVLDSRQIARFHNEARAAAQIHHPNIVPIYAVGEDKGVHFYAMQLIEGKGLDEVIQEQRGQEHSLPQVACPRTIKHDCAQDVDEKQDTYSSTGQSQISASNGTGSGPGQNRFRRISELFVQAATALHAAHEYGVIHRDVKPSNLMVDADGKIWITDFGLARCQTDQNVTRTGDVVGTVRYMSPEQARGDNAMVDHRADVYSLGATLYELTTLRQIFEGSDGVALFAEIESGEIVQPRTVDASIPRDLESIILRAIAPERDARYGTALEFADDLQRFLDGVPTLAQPPSPLERFSRWASRHRRAFQLGSGLLALVAIGLGVSSLLLYQEKTRTDQALALSEIHRVRAETNLQKAREIVDKLGARVATQLSTVAGAEEVRRALLTDMLSYYREFAEQSEKESLRHEVATTISKIASLTEHAGSPAEALDFHRQAGDLFAQLIEEEPSNSQHKANLALCQNNLATLHSQLGQIQQAEACYRLAIELQSELADAQSATFEFRRDLALTWSNLGLLLSDSHRDDEAKVCYEHALAIQQRLTTQQPSDVIVMRHLAASTANYASLLERSDITAAEESYAYAIRILQQLADARPNDAAVHSDLALTRNSFGAFLSSLGKYSTAIDQYRRSADLFADLAAKAPSSHVYRNDLALTNNNLGLALSKNGHPKLAEVVFGDAAEIQWGLLTTDPDNITYLGTLGGICNNLGMVREQTKDLEGAAVAYSEALESQEKALKAAPDNKTLRDFLSRTCFNYSRVCQQTGNIRTTMKTTIRRRELWEHDSEHLLSIAREFAEASRIRALSGSNRPPDPQR